MTSINIIVFSIFALNIIVLLVLGLNMYIVRDRSSQTVSLRAIKPEDQMRSADLSILDNKNKKSLYSFDNPFIAYHLLEKLDVFEVVEDGTIKSANYSNLASGLKIDNNYCEKHRAYFVSHPELVFEGKNFVTNYWKNHKLRSQVIPSIGVNLQPEINFESPKKNPYAYDLRVDANIFVTHNLFYYRRQIGKQFSCLSQASNHIPGHDKMYRKDMVGQALVDYAKTYKSRPECFNFDKYFPKTWVLKEKEQCLDFFKEFNSDKYQKLKKERNVVYFRKIGADVHEGKGVFPVVDKEETKIRKLYENGTLCGKVKDNNLIQYNIHNLLLVEKRKFGFRSFLLIASTNPVIAYYHDGYARLSLNEYNPNSSDIKTFVTNIGVNLKAAKEETIFKGMTEEQIQERTCWFLEDFHRYLMEKKLVTDPNWLDDYLRPEFKKVMIHLIRMSQSGFFQKSSVFEILGLDFVMDDKLQLWFIEANTMPLIDGFTKQSTKLLNQMLVDTFEIIFGLLRSRMKRVVNYINVLTKQVVSNEIYLPDFEQKKQEFKELSKNHFDPEFNISPKNTFHRIVDENYGGTNRYSDLIPKRCL